jgi:hypothetical protein
MTTKLMVCVKSCQAHLERGDHDVIRSTWGKDAKAAGIDVRFFVGSDFKKYQNDEIHLKCPDDYNGLSYKTREICKWASGKVLDYIFLCDTDTFLIPSKMLQCGFKGYDYAGKISRPIGKTFHYEDVDREGSREVHDHCYPWASGGYGYFLSRKAFSEMAYEHPSARAEDLWTGQVIGALAAVGEMTILDTPPNVYSWHFPVAEHGGNNYDPKFGWMQKMYAEHK